MLPWPTDQLVHSPWLTALRPTLDTLAWSHFPGAADWQALPATLRPSNQLGQPIQFVEPENLPDEGYEQRIARSGEVATRPNNWHDAFNALCWLSWPHSKAALNALHMAEIAQQTSKQRSRARDAATLFDESGLVLAVADIRLANALRAHDWHDLFQARRADWGRLIAPYSFGHALMEKSLAPFIGIVARAVVLPVADSWFSLPLTEQRQQLDQRLAQLISQRQLVEPGTLSPLPVLGIPGWWPVQDAAFYADPTHFRPKRPVVHPR